MKSVIIYGEVWCPYCQKAMKIKNSKFVSISGSNLNNMNLKRLLNVQSVPKQIPMIVLNNKYIGGYSDYLNLKKKIFK